MPGRRRQSLGSGALPGLGGNLDLAGGWRRAEDAGVALQVAIVVWAGVAVCSEVR